MSTTRMLFSVLTFYFTVITLVLAYGISTGTMPMRIDQLLNDISQPIAQWTPPEPTTCDWWALGCYAGNFMSEAGAAFYPLAYMSIVMSQLLWKAGLVGMFLIESMMWISDTLNSVPYFFLFNILMMIAIVYGVVKIFLWGSD